VRWAAPTVKAPAQTTSASGTAPPKQKRGHARKDARGKWQPTGDYDVGFGKPPKAHRFDGTKPGPGRPKESRSQDSYLREELEQTLENCKENTEERQEKEKLTRCVQRKLSK